MRNKLKLLLFLALLSGSYRAANAAGTVRLVTNTGDSGTGSLRAAVAALAGNGSATGSQAIVDTIRFDPGLKGDTIVLASYISINSRNVVIDGEDNRIVISGNNRVQLFYITANQAFVEISNLTLTAGYGSYGGAIAYTGTGTGGLYRLTNVRFDGNVAVGYLDGGAIEVDGKTLLIIDRCTFTGNTIQYSSPPTSLGDNGGGAIFDMTTTGGRIEISNSLFENNSSGTDGGAIVGTNLTVTGCIFKNNSAGAYGGAIALRKSGTPSAKILGNTFIGNRSESGVFGGVTSGGGALGTIHTAGNAVLAANIFQDNTSENNAAYNEFYHTNTAVKITSNGYNVFKGAAVPASGSDTWTGGVSDIASAGDIANAGNGRIGSASPAFQIVDTETPISGLAFPATDIFGNASARPYNAGADQGDGTVALEDITADQPAAYVNGEEVNIGLSLVGTTPPRSLPDIGFSLPAGLAFTAPSAVLKEGTAFTLSGITIGEGGNGTDTHLQLTVNFAPFAEQEYTDTLVISADGANDFVIPLRGLGISWQAEPEELQDFGRIAVGKTSEAQSVTLTGSNVSGAFSWSLKNNQSAVFPVTETQGYSAAAGGKLDICFAPAAAGAVYKDTLVIGSAGSGRIYEIPLAGAALPVAAAAVLSFGGVVLSTDSLQALPVTIAPGYGVAITSIVSSGTAFTVQTSDNWSAVEGGDLLVRFTPAEAGAYTATLTLGSELDSFDPVVIALEGTGLARPVIASAPAALDFGAVVKDETKTGTLAVTLADPQSLLTGEGVFTLAVGEEGIFAVASVTPDAETGDEDATVVLSFTPPATGEYKDTLIVRAAYAEEYRIPLTGTGFKPAVTSEPTSLDFGEVIAGGTKTGTLTVALADPFAPLTASDFTLAAADEEIFGAATAISAESGLATVTVTFHPLAEAEYKDTLIVQAAYADEYRIPLTGTGIKGAGISGAEASAVELFVRNGDIVVSRASANSLISVYNLQGQLVIAQAVTSGEEILKTASFPRGVYIVALRNGKQEIVKRKVIL